MSEMYIPRNKHTLVIHYLLYLTRVQSNAVVEVYRNAVLHFTFNFHCGPICGGQRVAVDFQLCGFPLTVFNSGRSAV